jgi:hypothetical protein
MTAILADYHHGDLFESHQLVFGDRFGWDLFRPIGMQWFEEGYWSFGRHVFGDALARQFLAIWGGDRDCGDWWERPDTNHPGRTFRMVTLEQARARRWDFILSSVSENDDGLHRFAAEENGRWMSYIGNQGQLIRWDLKPLPIVTVRMEIPYPERAAVVHQEFSLRDFRYVPPTRRDLVASFVPCFPATPPYALFREFAGTMPDFEWRVYGPYGEAPLDEFAAGTIGTAPGVAAAMRETGFIWHTKLADGFGHVVHNAFASGRPVVGSMNSYVGKMAGPLWVDGVTCIDLDRRSRDESRQLMRQIRNDPDEHTRMCESAAARLREVVDFDADADAIKRLLG